MTKHTLTGLGDADRYRPGPARDIAIEVTRKLDHDQSWDGDAPHPGRNYSAYVITVTAYQIINGRLYSGSDYLGSSWYRENEPIADIHGYYPQMREEAFAELNKAIAQVENHR